MIETLKAQINLATEAISFYESDLGKYMYGAAQIEINDAANRLITEQDPVKINRLQSDIKARQIALEWIADTIKLGEEAIGQLRGDEDE